MCASTSQKKRKSASPTPKSKKQKSASSTPPSNNELLNNWHQHLAGLVPEEKAIIERETAAARAAGGSRLAVAMHLMVVRRMLRGDATNPKQKKLWSVYLAANLPGFSISRAQIFRDIDAAEQAERLFPQVSFLKVFVDSGYALNVRPTVDLPLGKFTKPCEHILGQLSSQELGDKECLSVLADAAADIKAQAKQNRIIKPTLTVQQRRNHIYADIHDAVVSGMQKLSRTVERGYSYTLTDFRDDLETIVGRLMTAVGLDVLDVETKSLPDGFNPLSLPGSAVDYSESGETTEAAFAATTE